MASASLGRKSGASVRRWIDTQLQNLQNAKVAVLYASAYGNTATLAQAISRGVTKAGVGVEMVNLEQASLEEAETVLASSQGFCIGAGSLSSATSFRCDCCGCRIVGCLL